MGPQFLSFPQAFLVNGIKDSNSVKSYSHVNAIIRVSDPKVDDLGNIANPIYDSQSQELFAIKLIYSQQQDLTKANMPTTSSTETTPSTDNKTNQENNTQQINNDTHTDFITMQRSCLFYNDIVNQTLHNSTEMQVQNIADKNTQGMIAQYRILDSGLLVHIDKQNTSKNPNDQEFTVQVCIPKVLTNDILKSHVSNNHLGLDRNYAALRQRYFWPTMYDDCRNYIEDEDHTISGPMSVSGLFQSWHITILEDLPTTKHKFKFLLLVVDSYSGWCEAFPIRSKKPTEVSSLLFKEIFCRYGYPELLVSDRGHQFLSQVAKELGKIFSIQKFYPTTYFCSPDECKSLENMKSVFQKSLLMNHKGKQGIWPEVLPSVLMTCRMTPNTRSSPFTLLFGQKATIPEDTPNKKLPKQTILPFLSTQTNITESHKQQEQQHSQKQHKNFTSRNSQNKFAPNTTNSNTLLINAKQTITHTAPTYNAEDIDQILAVKRSQNTLLYKTKWKDKSKATTWEHATSIPDQLIRAYKGKNEMSSKRQHKRFCKISVDSPNPSVTGYEETYYDQRIYMQDPGNKSHSCWTRVPFKPSKRKQLLRPFLNSLFDLLNQNSDAFDPQNRNSKVGLLENGQTFVGRSIKGVIINDTDDVLASTLFKVIPVGQNKPIWVPLTQAPIKCVRQFLFKMTAISSQSKKPFQTKV